MSFLLFFGFFLIYFGLASRVEEKGVLLKNEKGELEMVC